MKKNIYDCDSFDKHKGTIIKFEPCEISKELNIDVNMDDCICSDSYPPCFPCHRHHHKHCHKHRHYNEKCDKNCSNNNFLLLLLEEYYKHHHKHNHKHHHKHRRKYQKKCKEKDTSNCYDDTSLLMLIVNLITEYFNWDCEKD